MEDTLYLDHLLDHYHHPRNYGLRDGFDVEVKGENPLCGDSITMRLEITEGRIADACFEHEGCVISRAAASLLLERIKGKTQNEIKSLSPEHMINLLGVAVMPARLKCAMLALEAIQGMV